MSNREDLMYELEKSFTNVFRKFRNEINQILGDEMSSNEFILLKHLSINEPKMASELSKEFNLSNSHVTAITDVLVKKGYIQRQRSTRDRRVVEISVTPDGELVVNQLEKKKTEYLLKRFENLKDTELKEMIYLFSKLV